MRSMNMVLESAGRSIAREKAGVAAVPKTGRSPATVAELWVTLKKKSDKVTVHPLCLWEREIGDAERTAEQTLAKGVLPVLVRHLSQPAPESRILRQLHSKGIPLVSISDGVSQSNPTIFHAALKEALEQYLQCRPEVPHKMTARSRKGITRGRLRPKGDLGKEERQELKHVLLNRIDYDDGVR